MNKFLLDIGTKKLEVIKGGIKGPIVVIETGMGVSMQTTHSESCRIGASHVS